MELINKELLSEILGENVLGIGSIEDNRLSYFIREDIVAYTIQIKDIKSIYYINIHELAHKCKEWAWSLTYGRNVQTYRTPTYIVCEIYDKDHPVRLTRTTANTEPETIFKACEWILKQKELNGKI